jgi:hypothetical protein
MTELPRIPDSSPYLRYRTARGLTADSQTAAADFHKLPLWSQLELNNMALQLLTGVIELHCPATDEPAVVCFDAVDSSEPEFRVQRQEYGLAVWSPDRKVAVQADGGQLTTAGIVRVILT